MGGTITQNEVKHILKSNTALREKLKKQNSLDNIIELPDSKDTQDHKGNVIEKKQERDIRESSDTNLTKLFKGTNYTVENGYLKMKKKRHDEEEIRPISNFVAIPTTEITTDNGLEVTKSIEIKGYLYNGRELRNIQVPIDKINSASWITSDWGLEPRIIPGTLNKDFFIDSIRTLAGQIEKKHIFSHTGWRKLDCGKWVFLYNGGAIGADNVSVSLDSQLSKYCFSEKLVDYKEAVKASFDFLFIGPLHITLPLLAITYLSPLNEFFRNVGIEPAFILFLLGQSGSMKSTIAGLTLSHFGNFPNKSLPSSFKDTSNALEKKGFILKDVLTVIDDYHPADKNQIMRMESTAQSITRSYGDRTGRQRMNADTTVKESYTPRGNAIITGEDMPNIGQSGWARNLIINMGKNCLDKENLTQLQKRLLDNPYLLSSSMRGYIEYLMNYVPSIERSLKDKFYEYRSCIFNSEGHARLAETMSWLLIGFEMALEYFYQSGVVSNDEKHSWRKVAIQQFKEMVMKQSNLVEEDRPIILFLKAFHEMQSSGSIILQEINSTLGSPCGDQYIGYQDSDFYYLSWGLTYNAIFKHYQNQGAKFPITKDMLLKHLDDEDLIFSQKSSKGNIDRTISKSINGKKARYVFLYKNKVIESLGL